MKSTGKRLRYSLITLLPDLHPLNLDFSGGTGLRKESNSFPLPTAPESKNGEKKRKPSSQRPCSVPEKNGFVPHMMKPVKMTI